MGKKGPPALPSTYLMYVPSLEKDFLQKAATSKRYSSLGIELKKQNDIAK